MAHPAVLIVDDDPLQLALCRIALRSLPCMIATVESGEEALHILRQSPPELVILDLLMPRISGLEILRAIRADSKLTTMKVVVFTAVPNLLGQLDAALCNMVLVKPFNIQQLTQVVENFLDT